MQDQLDLLILERVSDGHFDLTIPYTNHSRDIERDYRSRGFLVRSNDEFTTIFWKNPDLDKMAVPNTRIYSMFTAQQLYYVLTKGKDLRRLTDVLVYQELVHEKQIIDTYGMEKTTVYNLFNEAINKAIEKGYTVVVNDLGVISSNKNMDFNVDDHRPVTDNGGIDPTDLLSMISKDKDNKLELGTDKKLYVEEPLKTENW